MQEQRKRVRDRAERQLTTRRELEKQEEALRIKDASLPPSTSADDLERSLKLCRERLEKVLAQSQLMEDTIEELYNQRNLLKIDLDDATQRHKTALDSLELTRDEVDSLEKTRGGLELEKGELRQSLDASRAEEDVARDALRQSEVLVGKLTRRIENHESDKAQVVKQHRSAVERLKRKIEDAKAEVAREKANTSTEKRKVRALRVEEATILERKRSLSERVDRLEGELKYAKLDLKREQREVQRLNGKQNCSSKDDSLSSGDSRNMRRSRGPAKRQKSHGHRAGTKRGDDSRDSSSTYTSSNSGHTRSREHRHSRRHRRREEQSGRSRTDRRSTERKTDGHDGVREAVSERASNDVPVEACATGRSRDTSSGAVQLGELLRTGMGDRQSDEVLGTLGRALSQVANPASGAPSDLNSSSADTESQSGVRKRKRSSASEMAQEEDMDLTSDVVGSIRDDVQSNVPQDNGDADATESLGGGQSETGPSGQSEAAAEHDATSSGDGGTPETSI